MNSIARTILVLVTLLVSCKTLPTETPLPVYGLDNVTPLVCPTVLPDPESAPSFLSTIGPVGMISKAEYDDLWRSFFMGHKGVGGIYLTISSSGVDSSVQGMDDDQDRYYAMLDRVTLSINEQPISKKPKILDGHMSFGPFSYAWTGNLEPGYYQATLIFDTDAGETVKYSWNFCIIP